MELYTGAALTGMGYLLNKQREVLRTSRPERLAAAAPATVAPEKPSMKNVYASDYWSAVRDDEQRRSDVSYRNASVPFESGVVPRPAYASMFSSPLSDVGGVRGSGGGGRGAPVTSLLTGTDIPRENFLPENTQPFFRGSVRQNLDPMANNNLLENYTGRGDLYQNKKEVECFFQPTAGYANVCGMANNNDTFQERIVAPVRRANDFPVEQVRVAPGLGLGYTSEGLGGFQQGATLDYIRPKTVDELRPGNKPKANLQARVQGPGKGTVQRGFTGEVSKNRPDTWYEQGQDKWLKTRGANDKERQRPVVDLKPTSRVTTHVENMGVATGSAAQPGAGSADDYGKASIVVYDNERQTTQTRTVISNLTTSVKAVIAPLLDVMKHGVKEYLVDAPRTFGNMQAQMPSKPTVYDPVTHAMRTTIKETTIQDTTLNNPRGRDAVPVNFDDKTKTTVRETLPVVETTLNMSSHTYRVVMYNPDAVAKTTVRETTDGAQNPVGYVGAGVAGTEGAYTHIDVEAKNTQRQFLSDNEYTGDAAGGVSDFRPVSVEAAQNMEVDGTREALNIASGYTPPAGGALGQVSPSAASVEMESKRLVSDDMAARTTGNVTRVYQVAPVPIESCDMSRGDPARPNPVEGRLDPGTLAGLKTNPYKVSINPILG